MPKRQKAKLRTALIRARDRMHAPALEPTEVKSSERDRLHENFLCIAIRARMLTEITCRHRDRPILFAPHVVYLSDAGRVTVLGFEVGRNPDDTPPTPVELDMAQIQTLRNTPARFTPSRQFDPRSQAFRRGIICSVAL